MKSYYDILEINSNATKEEIKKQYKKLVRMYHPDVNSSLEAEKIFKEINRAAEILLNDEKRKNYDTLRNATKNIYNNYQKAQSSNKTFQDLFNKHGKKQEEKIISKKGDDINLSITITTQEAILGCNRTVNIVKSSICPKCKGYKFANGQKCPNCNGQGEISQARKITVKIPSCIKNGAKLRLKGEGNCGINGGENGNLYITINIEQNENLKIKNNIVYYDAQISPYTAILGGNITVPTLWGEATIKIPPLTKSNQSFKLIDVGVLDEKTHKKGDEIINIIIQIPSSITDEEYYLYEKLREINSKKKNAKATY